MERINSMHPSLAIVADQLIGTFLTASRALIPILLIIVLVYSLVRSLVQGQHITMDFKLLVRGLMLFFVEKQTLHRISTSFARKIAQS